jgi:hypothetical protein
MKAQELTIDLGFIGHKANKIQNIFSAYSPEPNECGHFLRAEDYSVSVTDKGVIVYTNCFISEEDFKDFLCQLLLISI